MVLELLLLLVAWDEKKYLPATKTSHSTRGSKVFSLWSAVCHCWNLDRPPLPKCSSSSIYKYIQGKPSTCTNLHQEKGKPSEFSLDPIESRRTFKSIAPTIVYKNFFFRLKLSMEAKYFAKPVKFYEKEQKLLPMVQLAKKEKLIPQLPGHQSSYLILRLIFMLMGHKCTTILNKLQLPQF